MAKTEEEYWAVRKKAGLIDLSSRGKVKVTGKDRTDFLHRMLTNDITNLKPGETCYAAFLTAAGKVLSDMHVHILRDFILLDVEPGMTDKLITLLSKYAVTEDVEFQNVTDSLVHFHLAGPESETFVPVPSAIVCAEKNRTGEKGYDLFFLKDSEKEKLKGIPAVGEKAAEILRIEAGILRYGVDFDEAVTLPETGLDALCASKTKGCYPGQEVVARTETYGGPKRKIIKVEGEPAVKAAGIRVTSRCISPASKQPVFLGYQKV